jgi:hypothetical protein
MDGIHDLGGKQGFGPVRYTNDARPFHTPWEVRATHYMCSQCGAAFSTWTSIVMRSNEWNRVSI